MHFLPSPGIACGMIQPVKPFWSPGGAPGHTRGRSHWSWQEGRDLEEQPLGSRLLHSAPPWAGTAGAAAAGTATASCFLTFYSSRDRNGICLRLGITSCDCAGEG